MKQAIGQSNVVLIVAGVIVFLIGGGLGIFYQNQKDAALWPVAKLIENMSSEVVMSSIAYGQITQIDDNSLTVSYKGDSLILEVPNGISVLAAGPEASKLDFKDLKVRDGVNVIFRILEDGTLHGQEIILLSPAENINLTQ